jgi:DNA-binding response OmpR family regulator
MNRQGEIYKVLVIDSNHFSAEKIASALAKSGLETMVASSECEALDIADERSPDAIVIRDNPPQLDGFKLCEPIRRVFDLPLILLGDKPETEVYLPNIESPTDWDYYMHLPIDYGELVARIKILLWRYGKQEKPGNCGWDSGKPERRCTIRRVSPWRGNSPSPNLSLEGGGNTPSSGGG